MTKGRSWGVLACTLVVLAACAVRLPEGQAGAVPMIPFTDEEQGIRGNAPLEGWSDRAALLQQSYSGTLDELTALLVEQTDLVRVPRSTGMVRGAHLTWHLYTFTTQLEDVGPDLYRLDMGLAHVEQEARYYIVTLITLPMEYETNEALYRTVFEHALYALEPLETAGRSATE
jgi:hypothetical protein